MFSGKRSLLAVILVLGFLGGACDNVFQSLGDKSSKEAKLEEARIAMDRGDFATAVPLLETLSIQYPADTEISRSLATAYSGRAGLNFFDLAMRAQEARDSGSSQDNTIGQLVSAFPHPVTGANISDIDSAINLMGGVSSTSGDPNDYFSLGLSYSAKAILLILKDTDLSPVDGVPETFSSAALNDVDAGIVYGSLDNAVTNFGAGKAGLDLDSEVLKSLIGLRTEINARPEIGVGNKLRAYLTAAFGGAL